MLPSNNYMPLLFFPDRYLNRKNHLSIVYKENFNFGLISGLKQRHASWKESL